MRSKGSSVLSSDKGPRKIVQLQPYSYPEIKGRYPVILNDQIIFIKEQQEKQDRINMYSFDLKAKQYKQEYSEELEKKFNEIENIRIRNVCLLHNDKLALMSSRPFPKEREGEQSYHHPRIFNLYIFNIIQKKLQLSQILEFDLSYIWLSPLPDGFAIHYDVINVPHNEIFIFKGDKTFEKVATLHENIPDVVYYYVHKVMKLTNKDIMISSGEIFEKDAQIMFHFGIIKQKNYCIVLKMLVDAFQIK